MKLPTRSALARAICCGDECRNPANCAATDTQRMHLVDIHSATQRVADLVINGYRAWKEAGPMSVTRRFERDDEA